MGSLFSGALKAVGGLFSNMFGGAAASGASGAATKSGGSLINGLLGKGSSNLPYSPTMPYSPIANGSTVIPSMQVMPGEQQSSGGMDISKQLGAAMGQSVGSKGGPGRKAAEAMGMVNPEMMGNDKAQSPMSMLAAMQQYQQPQQQPKEFEENPWLQYFMQNMGGGR